MGELVEGIDSAARAMNAETDSVVSCTRASPRSLQGPTKAKAVGSSLRRAANDLFSAPPRSIGHSSILAHELTRDHIHFAGQLLHGVCTRVVDHRAAKDGTGRGEELCLGASSRQMIARLFSQWIRDFLLEDSANRRVHVEQFFFTV